MRRFASLTVWSYAAWIVLTWTRCGCEFGGRPDARPTAAPVHQRGRPSAGAVTFAHAQRATPA
jgi:hypothetical protein